MSKSKKTIYQEKFLINIDLIPDHKRDFANELISEMAYMRKTLDGLQKNIDDHGMLSEFKQGSQKFLRENPALKSYATITQRYNQYMKTLASLYPDSVIEETDDLSEFLSGE